MRLDEYISDLLYRYECVIVPNFGGFVTNYRSARIKSDTFYAPYKKISFNRQLINNDGLLANYISSVDKIPYESAMNFIEFEVDQWQNQLEKKDIELNNIGTLSLEKDKLLFNPKQNVNYLTDSFGLSSFRVEAIKHENKIPVEEILSSDVVVEEKPPVIIAEPKVTREKSSAPNYLKYAAVAVIGLSLLGFGGSRLYNNYQYNQDVAKSKKQQKIVEDKIQKATFIITDPLPSVFLDATHATKPFHVIAGAFRYPENAERYVQKLKAEGYEARILGENSWGLTQVSFSSFSDREEAEQNLQVIRNTMNKEAWLLVQDL